MMNIAEIVAKYPDTAYVCMACGDPYDDRIDPEFDYCDNTIECTEPNWYEVATGDIITLDIDYNVVRTPFIEEN